MAGINAIKITCRCDRFRPYKLQKINSLIKNSPSLRVILRVQVG